MAVKFEIVIPDCLDVFEVEWVVGHNLVGDLTGDITLRIYVWEVTPDCLNELRRVLEMQGFVVEKIFSIVQSRVVIQATKERDDHERQNSPALDGHD